MAVIHQNKQARRKMLLRYLISIPVYGIIAFFLLKYLFSGKPISDGLFAMAESFLVLIAAFGFAGLFLGQFPELFQDLSDYLMIDKAVNVLRDMPDDIHLYRDLSIPDKVWHSKKKNHKKKQRETMLRGVVIVSDETISILHVSDLTEYLSEMTWDQEQAVYDYINQHNRELKWLQNAGFLESLFNDHTKIAHISDEYLQYPEAASIYERQTGTGTAAEGTGTLYRSTKKAGSDEHTSKDCKNPMGAAYSDTCNLDYHLATLCDLDTEASYVRPVVYFAEEPVYFSPFYHSCVSRFRKNELPLLKRLLIHPAFAFPFDASLREEILADLNSRTQPESAQQ